MITFVYSVQDWIPSQKHVGSNAPASILEHALYLTKNLWKNCRKYSTSFQKNLDACTHSQHHGWSCSSIACVMLPKFVIHTHTHTHTHTNVTHKYGIMNTMTYTHLRGAQMSKATESREHYAQSSLHEWAMVTLARINAILLKYVHDASMCKSTKLQPRNNKECIVCTWAYVSMKPQTQCRNQAKNTSAQT